MRILRRINFTQDGLDKLKKQHAKLLEERPAAVKELTRAREMGDLSENGLYRAAKSRLISIDASLRRISMTLKLAEVKTPTSGIVGIGSRVVLSDGEKEFQYTVVGAHEADPANKKISENSPIGRELIGRKIGETIRIVAPKKILTLRVIGIV